MFIIFWILLKTFSKDDNSNLLILSSSNSCFIRLFFTKTVLRYSVILLPWHYLVNVGYRVFHLQVSNLPGDVSSALMRIRANDRRAVKYVEAFDLRITRCLRRSQIWPALENWSQIKWKPKEENAVSIIHQSHVHFALQVKIQ